MRNLFLLYFFIMLSWFFHSCILPGKGAVKASQSVNYVVSSVEDTLSPGYRWPHLIYFPNGNRSVVTHESIYYIIDDKLTSIPIRMYHYSNQLHRIYFEDSSGINYLDKDFVVTKVNTILGGRLNDYVDTHHNTTDQGLERYSPNGKKLYKNKLLLNEIPELFSKISGEIDYHVKDDGSIGAVFIYDSEITRYYNAVGELISTFDGKVKRVYCDRYYLVFDGDEMKIVNSYGAIVVDDFQELYQKASNFQDIGDRYLFFRLKSKYEVKEREWLGYTMDLASNEIIDTSEHYLAIGRGWYYVGYDDGRSDFIGNNNLRKKIKVDDFKYDVFTDYFTYVVGDTAYVNQVDGDSYFDKYLLNNGVIRKYFDQRWYFQGDSIVMDANTGGAIEVNLPNYPIEKEILAEGDRVTHILTKFFSDDKKLNSLYDVSDTSEDLLA